MKKTTVNAILIAAIALMSVSICFLIFCILTRPRYVSVSEPETAVITEALPTQENTTVNDNSENGDSDTNTSDDTMHGKTSSKVNIRDAASSDAKILDTVEAGTTFPILEIQDNGWTKILYNDEEAYISSDYVIITND